MSDLRFASTSASFTTIFSKRGLVAEHGTSWIVPRLVGTGAALDLLWNSRRIDAAEAHRIGLVQQVVEPDDLLAPAGGTRLNLPRTFRRPRSLTPNVWSTTTSEGVRRRAQRRRRGAVRRARSSRCGRRRCGSARAAVFVVPAVGCMTDKTFETLLYEVDGGLARLTFNRPDAMNGMTNQMVREATEVLQLAATDASVRVLVITGAGSAFCPGDDLKHFAQGGTDDTELAAEHFQVTALLQKPTPCSKREPRFA